MKYFLKVLSNYNNFKGRSRRKEYWYFILFYILFSFIAQILDYILFGHNAYAENPISYAYLDTLFNLLLIIPQLSVGWRRMHDIGKSGWIFLVAFIPIIGAIWLLVLLCTDSNLGENKYGPCFHSPFCGLGPHVYEISGAIYVFPNPE